MSTTTVQYHVDRKKEFSVSYGAYTLSQLDAQASSLLVTTRAPK
jgi:hypothetical protein